jgi:hypothetical protein
MTAWRPEGRTVATPSLKSASTTLLTTNRLPNPNGIGVFRDFREAEGVGVPYEIRTRVTAVKGRCPGPLDERDRARAGGG